MMKPKSQQFDYLNCIKLCFAQFWYPFFSFLINTHFYNKYFLNLKRLFDDKVVSFTKNEYGSLE